MHDSCKDIQGSSLLLRLDKRWPDQPQQSHVLGRAEDKALAALVPGGSLPTPASLASAGSLELRMIQHQKSENLPFC